MNERKKTRIPLNPKHIDDHAIEKNKMDISKEIDDEIEIEDPFEALNQPDEPFPLKDEFGSNDDEFKVDNPFGHTNGIQNSINISPFDDGEDNELQEEQDYYEDNEHDEDFKDIYQGPVELAIDPDIPYFFIFGDFNAGKSAMLSGVLYYMKTAGIGLLKSLSSNKFKHQKRGDYILSEMTKRVRNGKFVTGTRFLEKEDKLPSEINLEFKPHVGESMPFCLLEMAGEDLKTIELKRGGSYGGVLDARIDAYLKHPECHMIFICVLDVDDPEKSEHLIETFISYIDKVGRTDEPILITLNKWDKVAHEYTDARDYIKKNLPILENLLLDDNRSMSYASFSIGEVQTIDKDKKDIFNYDPADSKKILEWMYSTATGSELGQKPKSSFLSGMFNSLKNMFSNE